MELKADGQPYEFKFGDANWSSGTNCGYLSEADDKVVELDTPVNANCSAVFENFRFTPPESAVYGFFFDTSGEVPQVYIKKAE